MRLISTAVPLIAWTLAVLLPEVPILPEDASGRMLLVETGLWTVAAYGLTLLLTALPGEPGDGRIPAHVCIAILALATSPIGIVVGTASARWKPIRTAAGSWFLAGTVGLWLRAGNEHAPFLGLAAWLLLVLPELPDVWRWAERADGRRLLRRLEAELAVLRKRARRLIPRVSGYRRSPITPERRALQAEIRRRTRTVDALRQALAAP